MEIYHLVVSVDKHQEGLFSCSDVLCDFLYPPPRASQALGPNPNLGTFLGADLPLVLVLSTHY